MSHLHQLMRQVCCRCASLDGDADRIVYWTPAAGGGVALFDGDRIAALAALLVRDLLDSLPPNEHVPTVRPPPRHRMLPQHLLASQLACEAVSVAYLCLVLSASAGHPVAWTKT